MLLLVSILLLPAALVVLECVLACLPGSVRPSYDNEPRPRLVVLMPAHNESAVISLTLSSIMPQLRTGDRLLLVADNCSDDTAELARAAGATVLERVNSELRGKSYALAFGMDWLRQDPPQVLLIIDADCQLCEGSLDVLANTAFKLNVPVQSLDLMLAERDSPVKQKIAAFAWIVKNQVRALGMSRLGMPCPLMGTGMAFPWQIISQMNLATGALAEDMLLGGELVAMGHAPVFCPAACVTSAFPTAAQNAHSQRQRWEHGHLSMIFNHVPKLLLSALKRGDWRGVYFCLDMTVPPLALQSMLMLLGLLVTGVVALLGNNALPFQLMLGGIVLFALALVWAWSRYARHVIGIKDALQIPLYVFSKISVYVSYVVAREKNWVKTKR